MSLNNGVKAVAREVGDQSKTLSPRLAILKLTPTWAFVRTLHSECRLLGSVRHGLSYFGGGGSTLSPDMEISSDSQTM